MTWTKRQKTLLHSRVQRAMILHTALHWALFLFGTGLLLFVWQVLFGEASGSWSEHFARMWDRHGPTFVVLLVLMPVVVLDSMKLGHRIAGPMVRMGSALRRTARGEPAEGIQFRKRDFWHEIAADFNATLKRIEDGSLAAAYSRSAEAKGQKESSKCPVRGVPQPELVAVSD